MTAPASPETVGVTQMDELKLGDVTITRVDEMHGRY